MPLGPGRTPADTVITEAAIRRGSERNDGRITRVFEEAGHVPAKGLVQDFPIFSLEGPEL
jgi:hypothetical protein